MDGYGIASRVALAAAMAALAVSALTTGRADAAIDTSSGAAASPSSGLDVRSAHSYAVAWHSVQAAHRGDRAQREAAVEALIAHVRAACPGILRGAAAHGGPIGSEAGEEVEWVATRVSAPALLDFAGTIERLRWTSGAIARAIGLQARAARLYAAVEPPDICVDARTYTTGGPYTVPAPTKAFHTAIARARAASFTSPRGGSTVAQAVFRLLAPDESRRDRALLRTGETNAELQAAERSFLVHLSALDAALGLKLP